MNSSNYKGTSIGFVLSPASGPAAGSSNPDEGETINVPVATLNAASEYIRSLERKVAELMNAGAR